MRSRLATSSSLSMYEWMRNTRYALLSWIFYLLNCFSRLLVLEVLIFTGCFSDVGGDAQNMVGGILDMCI
jgi:hypothetical protein